MAKQIVLTKDKKTDNDYTLKENEAVWITVRNLSVKVNDSGEGVVVDVFPLGEETDDPIASTWATFSEGKMYYQCPACKKDIDNMDDLCMVLPHKLNTHFKCDCGFISETQCDFEKKFN